MNKHLTTLSFQEGTSDKIYNAWIEASGPLWMVKFSYGRRGARLTEGVKTTEAVDYEKAVKIQGKLVDSKKAKGYLEV